MDDTFLMGTTSSITVQSLEKIVQRAPAVGAKMWCLFFFTGRMPRSGKLPVFFYSQAKNQVFRPAGATRYTDSGQTLQDRRAPGSAWLRKISRQSVQRGGNAAPKYQKFPLFGKESPRRGDSLDRFRNFFRTFIRLAILR